MLNNNRPKLTDIENKFRKIVINHDNEGGLCTYVLVIDPDKGEKNIWFHNAGCHGGLSTYSLPDKCTYMTDLYSSLWTRYHTYDSNISYAEKFWSFILDEEESPWKDALKGRSIVRDKNKRMCGIGLHDMDVPAQLMVNLLIATRLPLENEAVPYTFSILLDEGFTKYEALYISSLVSIDRDLSKFTFIKSRVHFPFSWIMLYDAHKYNWFMSEYPSLDLIKNSKPKANSPSLKDGGSYAPCNIIWKDSGESSSENHRLIAKLFEQSKYSGSFNKLYHSQHYPAHRPTEIVPVKDALGILRNLKKA